jgi:hypothetical protein
MRSAPFKTLSALPNIGFINQEDGGGGRAGYLGIKNPNLFLTDMIIIKSLESPGISID